MHAYCLVQFVPRADLQKTLPYLRMAEGRPLYQSKRLY